MDDPKDLNRIYTKWFQQIIVERDSEMTDVDEETIFFITLTFKRDARGRRRRSAEGQPLGQPEMESFHHLYNWVSRNLVGRNYHRDSHHDLLPKAIPFLDAEGSKYWRSIGEMSNLHIHSIWTMRGNQKAEFETLLGQPNDDRETILDRLGFDAIDVQEMDRRDTNGISRVISYSSKLIGFNVRELGVAEEFRVYPLRG